MPFPAFPQKMSSSTKLKDQSSAPKYTNGSSACSNPSHAERLPTAPFDRVTLTDIAADAGVSRATVSLVLRNSMSQLLAERRQPTAALCFNDMVVIGALRAWVNNGRSPGENFAIIGFDDVVEAPFAGLRLGPSQPCRAKSERSPLNSFWSESQIRIDRRAD
jgi:hypothetical protein